jgi:indolepyruvate ferredoxin oxidoreductase
MSPGQVLAFVPRSKETLDELIQRRSEFLTAYQNAAYAGRYVDFVTRVRAAESGIEGGKLALTEAVARYLFKLMAYKDEYEVARLHTDTAFHRKISGMFEGDFKLAYHLAPPIWSRKNEQGEALKSRFGAWMGWGFRLLAPMKVLRGTTLDVFGYTEERREERALIDEYRSAIEGMLPALSASNRDAALAFARVPEHIRGYGHVKARHLKAARTQWVDLLARYHASPATQQARAA